MPRVLDSETEEKAGEKLSPLDALDREGARRMLCSALEEEVETYIGRHQAVQDERGHLLFSRLPGSSR